VAVYRSQQSGDDTADAAETDDSNAGSFWISSAIA
jgi:hypothetical protein